VLGPTSVDRDRFDYIQAIATSWQIIGGYQLQAGISVGRGV